MTTVEDSVAMRSNVHQSQSTTLQDCVRYNGSTMGSRTNVYADHQLSVMPNFDPFVDIHYTAP